LYLGHSVNYLDYFQGTASCCSKMRCLFRT